MNAFQKLASAGEDVVSTIFRKLIKVLLIIVALFVFITGSKIEYSFSLDRTFERTETAWEKSTTIPNMIKTAAISKHIKNLIN